jgi:hypothetical protein
MTTFSLGDGRDPVFGFVADVRRLVGLGWGMRHSSGRHI